MACNPYWLRKFELTTHWSAEDRDAVIEHNRELWNKFKQREGLKDGEGISLEKIVPELVESLEMLSQQGYGFTDIGTMLGMTRERVRQYFRRYGLQINDARHTIYRVWDDEKERFVNVEDSELEVRLKSVILAKRTKRREEREEKIKQRHVGIVQDFFKENGRPPKLVELNTIFGYKNSQVALAQYWGYSSRRNDSLSFQEAIDQLYLTAGLSERTGSGGSARKLETSSEENSEVKN